MSAPVDRPGLRVSIIADLLDEHWPSMDLMAEMLMAELPRAAPPTVDARLVRPSFRPRLTPLVAPANGRSPLVIDRIVHRYWDYPRWLRRAEQADVYHIVDHSYAHLALELPAARVVVTCHDTDAFRTLIAPNRRESSLPRPLVRRVLRGLQRARAVVCDSDATRRELIDHRLVAPDRLSVVPIGVHPSCGGAPDRAADAQAAALAGAGGGPVLLHVGSTIPRKRVDTLLEAFARIRARRPDVTLLRVGGPFTREQQADVESLGLAAGIRVLPFVDRPVLAALYRRSALVLLPSEREGFGLPVVEALGCGTPILASDLPVLREVGGGAAEYAPVGQPEAWAARALALLDEREADAVAWQARRTAGLAHAARYSWSRYADQMRGVYHQIARSVPA